VVAAVYSGPIRSLIQTMKFKSIRNNCFWLGEIAYYSTTLPPTDLVTHVPLHPRRKNERGFDQAKLIAQTVARQAQLPYLELLEREVYLPPQSGIKDKSARLVRMQNVYRLHPQATKRLATMFGNSETPIRILLVDDVVTSGATMFACQEVLKRQIPCKVTGFAIARE